MEPLDYAIEISSERELELRFKLEYLKAKLPDFQDSSASKAWTERQGKDWTIELQSAIIEHRNIGHDWKFTEYQKKQLVQYYNANKLLMECLNSDCYMKKETRQEIEDTLFLPMSKLNQP